MGFCVADRPMRCTGCAALRGEALEREREMRAALGLRHGVDFVDDDGAHRRSISRPEALVSSR